MKLQKWNPMLHKYEDYEVPNDRQVAFYSDDMNELVQCANCGRWIVYGEGYVSWLIHTEGGLGYSVCKYCFDEECKQLC